MKCINIFGPLSSLFIFCICRASFLNICEYKPCYSNNLSDFCLFQKPFLDKMEAVADVEMPRPRKVDRYGFFLESTDRRMFFYVE